MLRRAISSWIGTSKAYCSTDAPPPFVPTYTADASDRIASTRTKRFASPALMAAQVTPSSLLLNTPPKKDPAYTVEGAVGSMTSADILPLPRLVTPQLSPPSVLLNTPPEPMFDPA